MSLEKCINFSLCTLFQSSANAMSPAPHKVWCDRLIEYFSLPRPCIFAQCQFHNIGIQKQDSPSRPGRLSRLGGWLGGLSAVWEARAGRVSVWSSGLSLCFIIGSSQPQKPSSQGSLCGWQRMRDDNFEVSHWSRAKIPPPHWLLMSDSGLSPTLSQCSPVLGSWEREQG